MVILVIHPESPLSEQDNSTGEELANSILHVTDESRKRKYQLIPKLMKTEGDNNKNNFPYLSAF